MVPVLALVARQIVEMLQLRWSNQELRQQKLQEQFSGTVKALDDLSGTVKALEEEVHEFLSAVQHAPLGLEVLPAHLADAAARAEASQGGTPARGEASQGGTPAGNVPDATDARAGISDARPAPPRPPTPIPPPAEVFGDDTDAGGAPGLSLGAGEAGADGARELPEAGADGATGMMQMLISDHADQRSRDADLHQQAGAHGATEVQGELMEPTRSRVALMEPQRSRAAMLMEPQRSKVM